MRNWLIITCFLLGALPVTLPAQDEIVIDIQGEPSALPDAPTLWDRNAVQLTRKLRGKTREQVLYAVPVVSDKDRIIEAKRGEYALVEYYQGEEFRKFLFKAESPQTFVAAAANAADVLAVNKKYGVNIGLSQQAFENFYAGQAAKEESAYLPPQSVLYKLDYTDVNTPRPVTRWFLFEKGTLTQTFETSGTKNAYLEAQKRQQQEADKARQQAAARQQQQKPQQRIVRKALISGGTEWDRAYLPRVVNPKPMLIMPSNTQNSSKK